MSILSCYLAYGSVATPTSTYAKSVIADLPMHTYARCIWQEMAVLDWRHANYVFIHLYFVLCWQCVCIFRKHCASGKQILAGYPDA